MDLKSSDSISVLDIYIKDDNINAGALQVISSIRPNWILDNVVIKTFTGGITNTLIGCLNGDLDDDESRKQMLLIRIYGANTELIIDREAETTNMIVLSSLGMGSELFARFNNGIVYAFMEGDIISETMIKDPKISNLIAEHMARFHGVPIDHELRCALGENDIFSRCKRWLHLVPKCYDTAEHNKRFDEVTSIEKLTSEFDFLKQELQALNSPLVYCHNDVLLGNVIYDSKCGKVGFIDFEYASINHEAFDIGNHFDEYAGVDDIDYSRYPDRETQLSWLRIYLETRYSVPPSDHDLQTLYAQVNKFALAAHFFWAVWAFIQTANSKIDFDFLGYGILRLNEYFNRKDEFLAIKIPVIKDD